MRPVRGNARGWTVNAGRANLLLVIEQADDEVRLFFLLCSSFSAPHQGCKPPTPADRQMTPRAGGRVIGKNGLARRSAERLYSPPRTGDPIDENVLRRERGLCRNASRNLSSFLR